jgi:hypothetical protein
LTKTEVYDEFQAMAETGEALERTNHESLELDRVGYDSASRVVEGVDYYSVVAKWRAMCGWQTARHYSVFREEGFAAIHAPQPMTGMISSCTTCVC